QAKPVARASGGTNKRDDRCCCDKGYFDTYRLSLFVEARELSCFGKVRILRSLTSSLMIDGGFVYDAMGITGPGWIRRGVLLGITRPIREYWRQKHRSCRGLAGAWG